MRWCLLLVVLAGCDSLFGLVAIDPPSDAASEPADATLPSGLVSWFPLEQTASGTVAELVAGRDGMCTGSSCPTATPGQRGGALLFDGIAQIVTATPAPVLNAHASFTLAAWARVDVVDTSRIGCIVSKRYGTGGSNSWQICEGATWVVFTTSATLLGPDAVAGTWRHFAVTWNATSTELQLFVDGSPAGPPMYVDDTFDDGAVIIGGDIDDSTAVALFPGAIDDVRLYSRVLDAAELATLAMPP